MTVPGSALPSSPSRPLAVVGHASASHLDEAVILALAAVLIGLTARDVLDGADAAPRAARAGRWHRPREWLRLERLAGLVPVAATLALSVLVWTTPMRTWLWGAAALFGATLALRPLIHGRRLAARPPTDAETRRLAAAGVDSDSIRVVDTARPTRRNGYSIGGLRSGTVGVSRAAVETLPPAQLAAVVAHERGHHAGRHALVRAAASVAWLFAGAAVVTAVFSTTTPAASAAIFGWLAGERLLAAKVGRVTEHRADAYAARHTSPAVVAALLSALRAGSGGSSASQLRRALSTHPGFDRRIARLDAPGEE